jgi:hypothetical protein
VGNVNPRDNGGSEALGAATLLADGTLTLGSQATALVSGGLWADTIVVSNSYATGSQAVVAKDTATQGRSTLRADMVGSGELLLEITRNSETAATIGAVVRRF